MGLVPRVSASMNARELDSRRIWTRESIEVWNRSGRRVRRAVRADFRPMGIEGDEGDRARSDVEVQEKRRLYAESS